MNKGGRTYETNLACCALHIYRSRKEPRWVAGGVFSALSCPHPCDIWGTRCTMFAMSGRLFQGGNYVLRNKQPYGLPCRIVHPFIKGGLDRRTIPKCNQPEIPAQWICSAASPFRLRYLCRWWLERYQFWPPWLSAHDWGYRSQEGQHGYHQRPIPSGPWLYHDRSLYGEILPRKESALHFVVGRYWHRCRIHRQWYYPVPCHYERYVCQRHFQEDQIRQAG